MNRNKQQIQLTFKNHIITLYFEDFDDEIDIDQLTSIDWTNLYAEIITIPALMNRVGLWKAEAENAYAEFKLDYEVFKAETAKKARKKFKLVPNSKGEMVSKAKSNPEIEEEILLNRQVQLYYKKLLRLKKEADVMDAIYWAVKSKEKKLDKVSENLSFHPEELEKELVEGKFNGILIRVKEKLIK